MNNFTDEFAKLYPKVAKLRDHFNKQTQTVCNLFELLKISPDSKILDAACGTGDLVNDLYDNNYKHVYAIDGSADMLKHFDPKNNIPFECCDWLNIESYFKKQGSFDCILILGQSLPCLEIQYLDNLLKKTYDNLNPGGKFIFDIRPWKRDHQNNLIDPVRLPEVKNFLAQVIDNDVEYLVEEQVSYSLPYEHVTYYLTELNNKNNLIKFKMSYHMFDYFQAYNFLEKAGFSRQTMETRCFPSYPYSIISVEK
jgi:SAM-dependent methyltransferase